MKQFKTILGVLLLLLLPMALYAQDSQSSYKFTKKGLVKTTVYEDSTSQQLTVLKPILIFKKLLLVVQLYTQKRALDIYVCYFGILHFTTANIR